MASCNFSRRAASEPAPATSTDVMTHTLRQALRVTMLLLVGVAVSSGAAARQVDWSKKTLQSERSRAYDALHYRIAVTLNLEETSFAGETTVTLTSLRDNLETVVLDA